MSITVGYIHQVETTSLPVTAGVLQMDVGHVAGAEKVGADETDARPGMQHP